MRKVAVVGAGMQGSVIADLLLAMQKSDPDLIPVGYLDDNPALKGKEILGLPVLGGLDEMEPGSYDGLVISIGNIETRKKVFDRLSSRGEKFVNAIHPSAQLGRNVEFGAGTVIVACTTINPLVRIGENVMVGSNVVISHDSVIGSHSFITMGSLIGGACRIGEGCWIGMGARILPECQVGRGTIVGAGAVVCEDLPENVLAVGIPAKIKKELKKKIPSAQPL